jgi:hypothetical protein
MEMALKHQVMQDVIVNTVYLGGSPSLVEKSGFGSGAVGYAKVQCALSDYEGDPLIAQYASSAMKELCKAAGVDHELVEGSGLNQTNM